MRPTIVYLIRHAQSRPSAAVAHSEWPLSRTGQRQAQRLGELLLPLGIERLISSPFARCLETIRPFAERSGLKVAVHEGLRERHLGASFDDFPEVWRRSWDDFDFAVPGFESSRDAQRRFVEAMEEILTEGDGRTIGVCGHGNVIGLYLNHLDRRNGRETAERLANPDVLRIGRDGRTTTWDRSFRLAGLADLATDPSQTPIGDEAEQPDDGG